MARWRILRAQLLCLDSLLICRNIRKKKTQVVAWVFFFGADICRLLPAFTVQRPAADRSYANGLHQRRYMTIDVGVVICR